MTKSEFLKIRILKYKVPIIFFFISILFFSTINSEIGSLFGDDAGYIILAKSLVSGIGYRWLNLPGNPQCIYPPFLFPVLLAPIVFFFGNNFFLMHSMIILMAILSMFMIYKLLRNFVDEKLAILVTFVTSVSPYLVAYLLTIMSDIPYLMFSLLAFYFINKYFKKGTLINTDLFLMILFLWCSYFTREIGIIIFISLILFIFFRKDIKFRTGKIILISIIYLIPVLLWDFRKYIIMRSCDYFYFGSLLPEIPINRILKTNIFSEIFYNLFRYKYLISKVIMHPSIFCFDILKYIWWLFISILVIGFLYRSATRISPLEIYFFIYVILVVFLPEVRYLVPVLPFIYYYYYLGANLIFRYKYINRNIPFKIITRVVLVIVVIVPIASNLFRTILVVKMQHQDAAFPQIYARLNRETDIISVNAVHYFEAYKSLDRGEHKDFSERIYYYFLLCNWIKNNLDEKAILMGTFHNLTYLFTDKQTIDYPSSDADKIIEYIRRYNVDYVIIEDLSTKTRIFLLPVIRGHSNMFRLVKVFEDSRLFQIIK